MHSISKRRAQKRRRCPVRATASSFGKTRGLKRTVSAPHRSQEGAVPDTHVQPPRLTRAAKRLRYTKQPVGRLEESERKYRLLAEHSADVIFTTDEHFHYTYISPAVERLIGYTPEEALGMSLFDILHEASHSGIVQAMNERKNPKKGESQKHTKTWNQQLRCKDGSVIWAETVTTPLYDSTGNFKGILGVARNDTARKTAEQALEQAHRDMAAILSAITAILVLVDENNRITHWNESAQQAFGFKQSATLGHSLDTLDITWNKRQVRDILAACRNSSEPQRLDDLHYVRPKGDDGLLGLTFYPVQGGSVLLLARDITSARTQELRQAHEQKMQSIGRLAAGMAHEINTPIHYIGFNIKFLQDAFSDIAKLVLKYRELRFGLYEATESLDHKHAAASLAMMEKNMDLDYLLHEIPLALDNSSKGIEQIAAIVQAMKQLSHPGRMAGLPMDLVDVNSIIRNAVTVGTNEWKHHSKVVLDLEKDLPLVPAWGGELGQVLLNVLLNAAQANEEAASTAHGKRASIEVSTSSDADHVIVSVQDSGPGVPESLRDKIFDPFFTTKDVGKGSGQGLAIAHSIIVGQHGGTITVDTPAKGGARFRILLPRHSTCEIR